MGGTRLAFQIIDPVYKIPMVWECTTAEFKNGKFDRGYLRYIAPQGEKVQRLYEGLDGTLGVDRLWVGPTFILVFGEHEQFPTISTRIQEVMAEVLGDFDFTPVGENRMDMGLIWLAMEREARIREET
jgi:hypothetical protein